MKLKILSIGLVFFYTGISNAYTCDKKTAKKEVERICSFIEKNGKLPDTETLFFNNCGINYAWIQGTDKKNKMQFHPIQGHLTGKSLLKEVDSNGKKLFIDFHLEAHRVAKKYTTSDGEKIPKGKHNSGWVEYTWEKPGASKDTDKISYVKLCDGPKNVSWIVGSGIWKEDLEEYFLNK